MTEAESIGVILLGKQGEVGKERRLTAGRVADGRRPNGPLLLRSATIMGLLIPRRSSAVATSTSASLDSSPLHIIKSSANAKGILVSVACVSIPIQRAGDDSATDGFKRAPGLKLVKAEKQLATFILDHLKGNTFLRSLFTFCNLPHPSSVLRPWEMHSCVRRLESSESLGELTGRLEGKSGRIAACRIAAC